MRKNKRTVELPVAEKQIVYERIKEGLAVASQLIIAARVKLPPKVVMVARYVALALGVLEAVENGAKEGGKMRIDHRLGIGTTGGTLLSVISQLGLHDVLKTAVLAAIGAVVSFRCKLGAAKVAKKAVVLAGAYIGATIR